MPRTIAAFIVVMQYSVSYISQPEVTMAEVTSLLNNERHLINSLLKMHAEVQGDGPDADLALETVKNLATSRSLSGKAKDMVMDLLLMHWETQDPDPASAVALSAARKLDPGRCPELDVPPRYMAAGMS